MDIRHKIFTIAGLVAAAFILPLIAGGCEETLSGTEFSLPYKEELMVQGFLTAGNAADTILITRTLPPLDEWTLDKAVVTDAAGTITGDGREYPLIHVGTGRYYAEGLRPVPGTRYTLNVRWKNLGVTATATIPPVPELVGVYTDTVPGNCDFYVDGELYRANEVRVVVEYVPHGANMNSATVDISYSYNGVPQFREEGYPSFFYDIDSSGNTNKGIVSRRCYAPGDPYALRIDTTFVHLLEYEADFRNFYDTRWDGSGNNVFFGPSGEHPDWNVTGDGFGWFFGRSTLRDTAVVQ